MPAVKYSDSRSPEPRRLSDRSGPMQKKRWATKPLMRYCSPFAPALAAHELALSNFEMPKAKSEAKRSRVGRVGQLEFIGQHGGRLRRARARF